MGYLTANEFWTRYQQDQQHAFVDLTIGGGGFSFVGKTLTRLDLRSVRLSELDLSSAILDGAVFIEVECVAVNWQNASLQGASLREINWQDQNLSAVNLQRANLMHAQLQRAILQGTDLRGANLTAANLRGANLIGADLRHATLGNAVLADVITDETTQWPDERALHSVRLTAGITLSQLTGRSTPVSLNEEQMRLPIPGRQGVLLSISEIREAIVHDWRSRPEQDKFRRAVLQKYQGRCAISGCDVPDVLEAAHIIPYKLVGKEDKNNYTNGILLRPDLHKLFDLGHLIIDPDAGLIYLAEQVRYSPSYHQWHRATLKPPQFPPALLFDDEERWRENLRWRQQYYADLLEGGNLFAQASP